MRVPDGSSIMSNYVRNFVDSHGLSDDLAEFELGFFVIDFVSLVFAFGIVEKSEVLSCLINGYYVHNTKRIATISSDFMVNFDHAFLVSHNGFNFLPTESVF
jgi:hypothetical protein